jgi:hypothetical protein
VFFSSAPVFAQSTDYFFVYVSNSCETPVSLSLESDGEAGAKFSNGETSIILQPTQYNYIKASAEYESINYNIVYDFYDGNSIDQRCSPSGNSNCASSSPSGMFAVSTGYYVGSSSSGTDIGMDLASLFGLSGTGQEIVGSIIDVLIASGGCQGNRMKTHSIMELCFQDF